MRFITSLILLCFSVQFLAQCPTTDISLQTQAEVDNFAAMYPNCDSVLTNIRIGWTGGVLTDITNLDSLFDVSYTEELFITDTQIDDLSGLDSLKGIGYFILARNDMMLNFNGADKLEYIRTFQIADLDNLTNMNGLEGVDLMGSMNVDMLPQLINFVGLENTVVNSITIQNCSGLLNLNGLSSTDTLRNFRLTNNAMLNDIGGLNNLQKLMMDLQIKNNASLSSCSIEAFCNHLFESDNSLEITGNGTGCSTIQEVMSNCLGPNDYWLSTQEEVDDFKLDYGCIDEVGTLIVGQPFAVSNMTSNIQSLDSLICIEYITGHLVIENNDSISSLAGLDILQTVGKSFRIVRNKRIKNLFPLDQLETIGGYIKIIENDSLLTTSGLGDITEAQEIFMQYNDLLQDVYGFDNLVTIQGDFFMEGMNDLNLATGLESLEVVDGDFRIEDCFGINSLASLTELDYIGGDFYLYYIGITNFEGLNNLDSLGGDFELEELENLVNMQGLESLKKINGSFEIYYCYYELLNFNGLNNLEYIGDRFYLEENYNLSDITALNNVEQIGGEVMYIDESESLAFCAIPAICNFINDPTKEVNLEDNLAGCNTVEEVLEDCESCPTCALHRTNIWLSSAVDSDWHNASNWSLGSVPNECQFVIIHSGENVNVTGSEAKCYQLTMDTGATLNGEVDIYIGCME